MKKQNVITQEGLNQLKKELEERQTLTRDKIADEIAKAREQGDLSENAAYSSALETKLFNESRILELEEIIKNSVVTKINKKDVYAGLGETLTLKREKDNKEFTYTLVGENQADPTQGRISIKSPIGMAANGKKEGQIIEINLPSGKETYKIIKIN
jgi:transcription elongation factor GreA